MTNKKPKISDIAQHITDHFIGQITEWIDSGNPAPAWASPWTTTGGGGAFPINAQGVPYRGSNVVWLWAMAAQKGFTSNQWFGYGAAKDAAAKAARAAGRNIESRDRKRGKGTYYWDADNDCMFEGGVRKGIAARVARARLRPPRRSFSVPMGAGSAVTYEKTGMPSRNFVLWNNPCNHRSG